MITITKLSVANVVLSGLFFDSPVVPVKTTVATTAFVNQDTATEGSWIGTYGVQGYDLIGNTTSIPKYAVITPSGQQSVTWVASTTDPRALETAGGSSRIAAAWFSSTSFTVDVNLSDGLTHDLELYFVDWDGTYRGEQVTLSNAATGTVLSTESISSFHAGVYLDWKVSGNVLITITKTAGANAVLSGLFVDPLPIPIPAAAFINQNTTTAGTWIGTDGTQGYDVVGNATSIPSYATIRHRVSNRLPGSPPRPTPDASRDSQRLEPHRRRLVLKYQLHGRRQSY